MSERLRNKAQQAMELVDKMLPIAYESNKSDELWPLLLELKGLVIQIKAEVKNSGKPRSSLPVNLGK